MNLNYIRRVLKKFFLYSMDESNIIEEKVILLILLSLEINNNICLMNLKN